MIITGETTTKSLLYITDDVNKENLDKVKTNYNNNSLYITSKFEMPTVNQRLIINENTSIAVDINKKLEELEKQVRNNTTQFIQTETQLKTFKSKVCCWCQGLFKDVLKEYDTNKNQLVFIHTDKISKHEWKFIQWLNECGVKFFIICKNAKELEVNSDSIIKEIYNTNDNVEYIESNENNQIEIINNIEYNNFDDIEQAIYVKKEHQKLIINGGTNYIDTCNFYGRLYKESEINNQFKIYKNGLEKPTYNDTNKLPKFNRSNTEYILSTLLKFLNIDDENRKNNIQELIINHFKKVEYKNITPQQFYNKVAYTVCSLNIIFNNNIKYIIIYKNVSKNDKMILSILSRITDISVIILLPDKKEEITLEGYNVVEFKSSINIEEFPTVDRRDNASTLASHAENRVNELLFSGDTLGQYKPGQFRTLETKRFTTTFDEIKLWWNKEMYIRPGFESVNDRAILPTMFKLIKGVNSNKYLDEIQQFCCGKTCLCKNHESILKLSDFSQELVDNRQYTGPFIHKLTDINKTPFNEQLPFFEYNKLVRDRIKNGKNYKYGFMDINKQDLILDKIELLLTSGIINSNCFSSTEIFIENVLNLLLNLNINVLQYIQWFEFYTYNPNLVVILNDREGISANAMIIMSFLGLMGFDILIYVPTCYNTIEQLVSSKFIYDTHIIGEANYCLDFSTLSVTQNIEVIEQKNKNKASLVNYLKHKEIRYGN